MCPRSRNCEEGVCESVSYLLYSRLALNLLEGSSLKERALEQVPARDNKPSQVLRLTRRRGPSGVDFFCKDIGVLLQASKEPSVGLYVLLLSTQRKKS